MLMVVHMMVLMPVGMAVTMVVEVFMFVRVVMVIVTMVMGTMGMIMPASRQQRPDAPPEHCAPKAHHDQSRHRTQPRVELLREHVLRGQQGDEPEGAIEAGLEGLVLLKTTDSGFSKFLKDDFTTLPETNDRILATNLTAKWMYNDTPDNWREIRGRIRATFELLTLTGWAPHESQQKPLKPGSASRPFPGVDIAVLDEDGNPVAPNEEGYLVIRTPWPGMLRTIYGDPDRYVQQYWSRFPGVYMTGDSARIDVDGYVWVIGRVDDVIKVSGYRLGTAEIESALVSHPSVAEAAVIGVPDEVRGNVIQAYCILKSGVEPTQRLVDILRDHVAHEIGPIAKPSSIEFVDTLPKTRSGKIMRRVLKARALGQDEGDLSTLET